MDLVDNISFSEESLNEIIEKGKDWALLHGFTMRMKDGLADHQEFLPFTLLPSSFPRKEYEKVNSVQHIINRLMHLISYDTNFLLDALERTIQVDEFTRRLMKIYNETLDDRKLEVASLGLLRSDFMLDVEKRTLLDVNDGWYNAKCKQVEVNTIASGQGWIATACSQLHRYVLQELNLGHYAANLPVNNPLNGLCSAMLEAWKIYDNPSAAILFIVEETTRQIADQRYHEYCLRELNPLIRVLRRKFNDIYKLLKLEGSDNRLIIDGHEIAMVYFRTGYAPEHYHGDKDWRARMLIERSKAIKCPTVGYQLAGTKKVQQILTTQSGCLERFLHKDECEKLRRLFTGQYSLDTDDSIIEAALSQPENFVLKPQREGGSNNYFNEELRTKLQSMQYKNERHAWILMDRIKPPIQRNYIVRSGDRKLALVNSELGIFGAILGNKDKIFFNQVPGHTLRTKLAESDEGGLSAGFGFCDSPFLI